MIPQEMRQPRIVVVGPCASGKTTLVGNLSERGFDARACVQEHSAAPGLWHRRYMPQVLIYLDASLSTIAKRQRRSDWTEDRLDQQHQRLQDARKHCDLYVCTDQLTREQVVRVVEGYLRSVGVEPLDKS